MSRIDECFSAKQITIRSMDELSDFLGRKGFSLSQYRYADIVKRLLKKKEMTLFWCEKSKSAPTVYKSQLMSRCKVCIL